MNQDHQKPFEQKPDETAKAFEAFTTYLNLGAGRSLAEVARQLRKSEGLIARWSRRHHWGERVNEHGRHIAVLTRQAEVQVVNEFALEHARRRAAQEESEWQTRCELLALAREKIQKWREMPDRLGTLEGIARLLELASKLGRLSCGMATDKTETEVSGTRTLSIEYKTALEKIYGEAVPAQFIEVESTSPRPSDSFAPAHSALGGPSPSANSFHRLPGDSSPQSGEGERKALEVKP